MTTPALSALRAHYPDAWIDCVTSRAGEQVLRQQMLVDRILHPKSLPKLKRKGWYSAAILFNGTNRNIWWSRWLGIKKIIGQRGNVGSFLLTDEVKIDSAHKIQQHNELIQPLGITNTHEKMSYKIHSFQKHLNLPPKFIVLNPGGDKKENRWPPGYFARIANMVMAAYPHEIVIIGNESELKCANEIERQIINRSRVLNLAGKTSLPELASTLQKSSGMITCDSDPLSLGVAVGVKPLIAIFGMSNRRERGPLDQFGTVVAKEVEGKPTTAYKVLPEEVFTVFSNQFPC